MALVASVDYPNKRIILGIDSVGVDVNVIDVYTEMRARRRLNADGDQGFLPMITAQGNESLGASNTPRRAVLAGGVRIIPYDGAHILSITPVPLVNIDDGLAGVALFDRTTLVNEVDIDYQPLQVEIIERGTSGLTAGESASLTQILNLHEADEFFDKTNSLWHKYQRGTTTDLIPPKNVSGEQVIGDVSATE